MADGDFFWIYLIFFAIPLARIIPRLVKKWQNKNAGIREEQYGQNIQRSEQRPESLQKQESFERQEIPQKPQNKEMQVLGEINRGVKNFNHIQKITNTENQKLENILKDLEDEGLLRVVKKEGMFGVKIELYPTEKGYKKFYT